MRRLCALFLLALAFPAAAQNYPSQPIRMIAPFPPGGSVDITARLIAEPLAAQLATRILIDNRSGASGNIGMEAAARAAPDGYTIVLNTIPLVTNQSLFDKLTWDPIKDFAPIGMVATSPHVLVVPSKMAANKVDDLVRMARILHVPYRGGGPALLDTLAGQVDMSFPTLSAALPHVKAGTLRALGVTGPVRSSLLPDVPTLQEAGVKDFQFTQWLALLAPANTPAPVVNRLNTALRNALNTKELRDKFEAGAFEAFITTPEEAGRFLADEVQRFSKLIKTRKITSD